MPWARLVSALARLRSVRLQIDHVTAAGSDLASLRQEFSSAGLKATYGGAHANGLTHMVQVGFEDGSYLELIAPIASGLDPKKTSGMMSGWAPAMAADAGPCAWAVRTATIDEDVRRLRAAGVSVRGPEAGSRSRPDGKELRWRTAMVGDGPAGAVLPFLIEDETPRELRVQAAEGRAHSGGVGFVVIAVPDLGGAVGLFQSAAGLAEPELGFDHEWQARLAYFPESPVILAQPQDARSWLQARLERFGAMPAAFVFLGEGGQGAGAGESSEWFGQRIEWRSLAAHGGRLGFIRA